jgi:hypothetical protein
MCVEVVIRCPKCDRHVDLQERLPLQERLVLRVKLFNVLPEDVVHYESSGLLGLRLQYRPRTGSHTAREP